MARRPTVVAFDVLETLFSLEPLAERLGEVGLDGALAPLWIARLLRDAFALEVAGVYRAFREVAGAALTVLAAGAGRALDEAARDHVLDGFAVLPPQPDAEPALRALRAAGVRAACLTNGAADATTALLHRGGLHALVDGVLSVDEIQHWKPLWDVYLHAAERLAVEPPQAALVSAHAWDIEGARQAGLTTAWLPRRERRFSPILPAPDVEGADLVEVVQRLLSLPEEARPLTRPPTETLH